MSYAHIGFPDSVSGTRAVLHGGSVKYLHLDKVFPHAGLECRILYVVSSGRYRWLSRLLHQARNEGILIVWNQNGALFPSAYGAEEARRGNAELAHQMLLADYVIYQSAFARMGSDHFLGPCRVPQEILHNAVDTSVFIPGPRTTGGILRLILCGSHNDEYRVPLALDVVKLLLAAGESVSLTVAGRIAENRLPALRAKISAAGIAHAVAFTGAYTQAEAPDIYRRGDMLLHTQYNDVCPSVVVEALACGLPVVYSCSGGTPELVGEEAGVGIPSVLDWDVARPPSAEALAAAVQALRPRLAEASRAARARAVERFDLKAWIGRHAEVFHRLVEGNA